MKRKLLQSILCLTLLLSLAFLPVYQASALKNEELESIPHVRSEENAVHIDPNEIEAGTLIIGTHLIHISALNESIYFIATESANQNGQYQSYYRSELAGGVWMDITDAAGLSDITSGGKTAGYDVIAALWLTHHTKPDQITYDLFTGQAVNPFDITDPYDVSGLSEFEELTMLTDELNGRTDLSDSDKAALEVLEDFFGLDLRDSDTGLWDTRLNHMQDLKGNIDAGTGMDFLNEMMESADASRRAIVYEKLCGEDVNNLLTDLQKTGKESLVSAMSNGLLSAADSSIANEAKIMGDEEGLLGEKKNQMIQEFYEAISAENYDTCSQLLEELGSLENARDGTIQNQEQLEYVIGTLIPAAQEACIELMTSGVTEEYQELAKDEEVTKNELQDLLNTQRQEAAAARQELQTLVQSAFDALENEKQEEFIRDQIDGLPDSYEAVPADDFKDYANEEIEEYQDWLDSLLKAAAGGSSDEKKRAQLEQEKEEYLALKSDALDNNNLAKAKEYDLILDELNDELNQLGGAGQPAIESEKENALSGINKGSYDEVKNNLENLKNFAADNSSQVLTAMKEIYNKLNTQMYLEDSDADDCEELIEIIEEFIAGNANLFDDTLDADEISGLLEEFMGSSLEKADAMQQAAAILAMHLYGEYTGDKSVHELAAAMAEKLRKTNRYLFLQYKGTVEYLPVKTIGVCIGYRYVFHKSELKVTLSKGSDYYEFNANAKKVIQGGEAQEEMNYAAKYKSGLYIEEAFAYDKFGTQAAYLRYSDLGLLVTDEIMEQAEEIVSYLLEQGGD